MMRSKGRVSADDVGIAEIGQTINRRAQYMLSRHGRVSAVVLLCVVTVLLLLQPLIELPQRISNDYNEGWNAYHADRALGGKILYPQYTDLIANNYPPVSFYLVGSIGRMIGDNIIAGRLVALLSLVGVAVSVAVIVHLIGGSWFGSFIGAVFLVGYMAARHSQYVATNDPQWLGHAVMMAGWVLFIQSKHSSLDYATATLARPNRMVAG
jgi:4-amino-4-deoxy-L-arabinose transferase-like glycosyltransferase